MKATFRLLGPVEVRFDGRVVDAGHVRQCCVLAALLVDANRPVPADRLLDRAWGDQPPQRPGNAVSGYISRLRRLFADADEINLTRERGGYLLSVDPTAVDLHRFAARLDRADAALDPVVALTLYDEALALWQGEPFAALDTPWLDGLRGALCARRYNAELDRADVALALGRDADLLDRLAALADENPLDERLAGQHMLALYRRGRQAEALRHYERLRHALAEDLGIDPGPLVQLLHKQILTGDIALTPAAGLGGQAIPVPRELPAAPAAFTGRAAELATLDGLLDPADDPARAPSAALVVAVVSGPAGVGKTALALHWAHRVAAHFHDGQLYLNLRGFDPDGPVAPADALQHFLQALGVPPAQIPAGLDARAGRFRSLLAGRRVQVVLDNARDVGQVRPLLPGSPGCTIVVTSRDRLSGLLRTEGAHPVMLDLLTADDARDLLVRYIGRDRATAEPAAVGEIVERCDRLPLALTVVAARAAENPRFRLAALSDELRGHASRLDALAGDDPDGVRTAFSWSYRALSPVAADLFRLLGLHPGPDIGAAAAASLAGLAPARTRPLLAELTRTCLVVEHQPGRYTLHDLLRAYAAERAADGPEPWRRSAVHRLLDHYLHTARAAALLLDVYRDPVDVADPGPGVLPDLPADHGAAIAWFTAERPVLLAAIRLATDSGFDHHVWRLVWSCGVHLYRQGRWDGFAAMCHLALAASQRLADPVAEAHARVELGFAYARLHHPDAQHHARRALELFTRLGDHRGQASCHLDLSWFLDRCGRHGEAFGHALRALALYRSEGDLVGEARALNGVGFCHARLGDHRAIEHCEHALALHQQLDDTEGEAQTWDSLGYAHHRLGRHSAAVNCYRAALRLFRENGNRYHEADVLRRLGDSLHAVGDADGALDAWHSALHLLEELEHPDADRLRARMPQT